MPTQIAQAQGIHPYWTGADTLIGVDESGTKWSISYRGKNAILLATFEPGVSLEFKIPTSGVNKTGSVAAFTIPNFGDAQWVTHREHVKFEVRFPTGMPKVSEVSMNIARQGCDIASDGSGGLLVSTGGRQVGALPRPWVEYVPDGAQDRVRLWLDWVLAEPTMKLTMPTLTASEWATAVLDPTVITTSTASTATAYSNQRKIDRCQNGVLWTMYWDGTSNTTSSMHFRYSADDGTTWSDGGGFGFAGAGTTYTPNGSFFIDVDDYAHVAYKDRSDGKPYYRRGTPNAGRTAWTWSAATALYTFGTEIDHPDVVAHREGTGWTAHVAMSYLSGTTNQAQYEPVTISSTGAIAAGARTTLGGSYVVAAHLHPSVHFNHTGDGKTVAGGTPHLHAAWSAGATGAGKGIRFKKASYSGGTWTWGTEQEIDSTSFANGGRISSIFDGTRVVIAYADSAATSSIKVRERDAADTTTTTHTPTALADGTVTGLSVSHDDLGNIHLGAVGDTSDDVKSLKYDRAAGTWGTWATEATASAQPDTLSLERGYSNNGIALLYTDGTASPFSVTHDKITLTVPPNQGTATGSISNSGSAVGARASRGSASGSVANDGSATGAAPAIPPNTGTASGSITITGSARGGTGATAVGTITITGSATGFAPEAFFAFRPPVRWVGNGFMGERPFRFYRHQVSMNVVRRNGRFTEARVVEDQKDHLTEGVDWFSGGRTYQVDNDTRLLLEADGFTVETV